MLIRSSHAPDRHILILMVVAPLAAIALQTAMTGGSLAALAGKWFVFFFGLRLLTAGLYQIVKPQCTAQTIFRITDPNARKIVSELGIANVAMGGLGVLTLVNAAWLVPGAIVLMLFYGLAAGKHLMNAERTASENWATWSDAWAGLVLAGWLVTSIGR